MFKAGFNRPEVEISCAPCRPAMSGRICKCGTVTMWALLLSVGMHVVLFAVFAAVKFSSDSVWQPPSQTPKVTVNQIKKLNSSQLIIPKPKIKKLPPVRHSVISETTIALPDHHKPEHIPEPLTNIRSAAGRALLPRGSVTTATTEFFGQVTERRKICYVIDCSGSMQGLFNSVQHRLKASIANLQPDHYFYIIFFRGDELVESGNGRLVRARPKAKSRAGRFIDSVRPGGTTNALSALKRAMQIRGPAGRSPQLIYFLTDGFDLDIDQSAGFAARLENMRKNLAPATRINTIGFWARQSDCRILKTIADQSGGRFTNVE